MVWLTPLGSQPWSAAKTAPVCQTHPVEIPFSKERLQLKTLFITRLFWRGGGKKATVGVEQCGVCTQAFLVIDVGLQQQQWL